MRSNEDHTNHNLLTILRVGSITKHNAENRVNSHEKNGLYILLCIENMGKDQRGGDEKKRYIHSKIIPVHALGREGFSLNAWVLFFFSMSDFGCNHIKSAECVHTGAVGAA